MFVNPESTVRAFDIRPGMTVADIGSGAGFFTFPIARAVGRNGKVLAVDVRREMLDLIRGRSRSQGLHNIQLVWTDLETLRALPVADASVDAALLANVLFQLERKDGVFAEIHRILKPGGMLFVIDWSAIALIGGSAAERALGPPASARVNKQELEKLASAHGFLFTKEFSAGEQHYGMAFRRET